MGGSPSQHIVAAAGAVIAAELDPDGWERAEMELAALSAALPGMGAQAGVARIVLERGRLLLSRVRHEDPCPALPWAAPANVFTPPPSVDPAAVAREGELAFSLLARWLSDQARATHLEISIAELGGGTFVVVSGGKQATLDNPELAVVHVWMHTHPHWLPATGPSLWDLERLASGRGQAVAYLVEPGRSPYAYSVPDDVATALGWPRPT